VRILIVQTAFLGDVVLALPLIAAVRQRFASACVDVLTIPAHAPILQNQPLVDAVLTYDKRGRQKGIRGLLRMLREIRTQGYDLIISPHRSLRSALLVAGSGSPQRVGFRHWLTRWAYTSTVTRPMVGHEVERNHQLMICLNGASTDRPGRIALHVEETSRREAEQYFAHHGVEEADIVVGMIPGSQWGTKRWPAEQFAALIERLSIRSRTHCVLFGAPSDRPIADAIVTACQAPVLDLVGQTALSDLPAYLASCTVVVSNDTGPMHVAAALGKPIVTLYGPTTAALGFSPYGVEWEEASVALDCRPCHAHGPPRCPLSHWRCMRALSAEQVADAVQRLLHRTNLAAETG
jgi:heptosyltransferase II